MEESVVCRDNCLSVFSLSLVSLCVWVYPVRRECWKNAQKRPRKAKGKTKIHQKKSKKIGRIRREREV